MLYLNEKLFSSGISETSQCSFCNQNNKTIEHLFCHCFVAKALWNGLSTFFKNHLSLYDLTPQATFFEFIEKHLDHNILQNHLLLVFKKYLYKLRSYGLVCWKSLFLEIKKINCLEKKNGRSKWKYPFKWNKIDNQLTGYN